MKIMLVIPTLGAGGAERVAAELANAWCRKPNTEVVIALLSERDVFYDLDQRVRICCLGFKVGQSRISKALALVGLAFKFRRLVMKEKPDGLLSFMNKYNVFALLSLVRTGRRIVVSERDSPTERLSRGLVALRDYSYKLASGVICQTKDSREFIRVSTGNQNVVSIPNPVRPISIGSFGNRDKVILNIGRLVPKKGHKFLLEAFSRLEVKDWTLTILGDGPLRAELSELARKLGVDDRVTFAGTVRDVESWLSRASVFAFPSILEGFPNALAEAMVSGVPSVSFDCDTGPRELINDGENGFLVPVGDVEAFTEKLQLLVTDKALREKFSRSAAQVGTRLDRTAVADKYLEFCMDSWLLVERQ